MLHGDIPQSARDASLKAMREGVGRLLVATDVAARGLDLPLLPAVVNHGMPRSIEQYIHRIGRTGRAGQSGTAHTIFVKRKDTPMAPALVRCVAEAGQEVPEALRHL